MESEGGRASDSPRRVRVGASLCCADLSVAVKPAPASLPGDAAARARRPGRDLRKHLQHEVTSISHLFNGLIALRGGGAAAGGGPSEGDRGPGRAPGCEAAALAGGRGPSIATAQLQPPKGPASPWQPQTTCSLQRLCWQQSGPGPMELCEHAAFWGCFRGGGQAREGGRALERRGVGGG